MPPSARYAGCSSSSSPGRASPRASTRWSFGDGFNLLDIPHYPFFFVIAFGSLVFALVLVVLGLRSAFGLPEIARRKADE